MNWRIEIGGVDTLLIYADAPVAEQTSARIQQAAQALRAGLAQQLVELVPSYTSLLLQYDVLHADYAAMRQAVLAILAQLPEQLPQDEGQLIEIPVYYSAETGPDLLPLAQRTGLSVEEVIALHTATIYRVYAIGFAPGFAYLGQVDERLASPRLATPRLQVPAGSVGIAERQTAIYPLNSPGGWNLLGRTPLRMFDAGRVPASLLAAGQRVRFQAISQAEFVALGGQLEEGTCKV
ncbi:5-oxoprolinase subunit PxpB [Balneatrix alpica]|uniref:5-oxoprolinase subunit PxpB n=1 Tax=Balneatrix alpica TaxID=75684 RepID=A0ABV5ZD33_9GAMM|nr:5-oxoprolinase subunit PxpB [Balneatrix alpica]